jgi:hypothetical protein
MTGTSLEVNFISGIYNLLPNRALSAVVHRHLAAIGPPA